MKQIFFFDFFAGRSTQQGSAPVAIGVEVKDTAQHTETKSRNILVSKTGSVKLSRNCSTSSSA
jgi:hypothetical protein